MPNPPGKKKCRVRGCSVQNFADIEPICRQRCWSEDDFAYHFSVWTHTQPEWPYPATKMVDRSTIQRAKKGTHIERRIARFLDAFVEYLKAQPHGQTNVPSPPQSLAHAQVSPTPSSAEPLHGLSQPPKLCQAARQLLDKSKTAYIEGYVRLSLEMARKAKDETQAWPDVQVGTRLITCLLRYGRSRWTEIRTTLDQLAESNPVGPELDSLRLLKSDFLARQEHWDEALNELGLIHGDNARRDYQQGMCCLALSLTDKQCESNIVAARNCFASAHELRPEWWYATLNLALVDRVNGRPDAGLERQVRQQIEMVIEKYPMKSSARFYRLLHIIMTGTESELKSMIDQDHMRCPRTLEVSQDFYDTMSLRVRLLHGMSPNAERILQELRRWPEKPFLVLK